MKIAVLLLFSVDWKELALLTINNLNSYCKKHGYILYVNEYDDWPSDAGYRKLVEANRIFREDGFDAIMVVDADVAVVNLDFKIEELIEESHKALFISKDYNGINAGVFILKKHYLLYNLTTNLLLQRGKPGMHCEQDAINYWFKTYPELSKHCIQIVPQNILNGYMYELYPEIPLPQDGQVNDKSLILHLPGVSYQKRIEILSKYKPQ